MKKPGTLRRRRALSASLGSSPLARGSGLRAAPIDRRRKVRTRSEFARIYGSKKRVEWIASSACVICTLVGHSDNAHVVTGGTGRKADARFIVPLCAGPHGCHADLHRIGIQSFEKRYRVDLLALAAQTEAAWRAHVGAAAA